MCHDTSSCLREDQPVSPDKPKISEGVTNIVDKKPDEEKEEPPVEEVVDQSVQEKETLDDYIKVRHWIHSLRR